LEVRVKGKLNRHTSDPILTFATVKSTPAQRRIYQFSGQSSDRMQLGLRRPTEFFADCQGSGRAPFCRKFRDFRIGRRIVQPPMALAGAVKGHEVYLNSSVKPFNQNASRWSFARQSYLFKLDQCVSSMSAITMHTIARRLHGAFPPAHDIV